METCFKCRHYSVCFVARWLSDSGASTLLRKQGEEDLIAYQKIAGACHMYEKGE